MALVDELFFSLPRWLWITSSLAFMCVVAIVCALSRKLTPVGAACSAAIGFIVLAALGFGGLVLLLLFFVPCSAVKRKDGTVHGPRKAVQVLANGLVATAAAILGMTGNMSSALLLFGTAVAEAASDTMAGEIGRRSARPPVSILTGLPVLPGMSGGVTPHGFAAGLGSSIVIAAAWHLLFEGTTWMGASAVAACGFAGCVFDSFLGASCQAIYEDAEGKLTEEPETDGKVNKQVRGVRFMDNNMVNLVSNAASCALCLALSSIVL